MLLTDFPNLNNFVKINFFILFVIEILHEPQNLINYLSKFQKSNILYHKIQ